jgi:hypothetical protein
VGCGANALSLDASMFEGDHTFPPATFSPPAGKVLRSALLLFRKVLLGTSALRYTGSYGWKAYVRSCCCSNRNSHRLP